MKILPCLLVLNLLCGCSSQQSKFVFNGHQCFPRTGDCVRASFDGEAVIPIRSKSILKKYEGDNYYIDDVEWEVVKPVSSDPTIIAVPRDGTEGWFGSFKDNLIEFIELDNQEILTGTEVRREDSVRVGGKALQTEADVFTGDQYPAGNYLFFLKVQGTKNWDRATVFVRIK